MTGYTKEELEEALKSITSTIGKCEKAMLKLKEHSAQHTLLSRRIKAFRISVELIEKALSDLL
jgi:F0F1-type ATP synthase assembly protein I